MSLRQLALGLLTLAGHAPFAAAQCGPFFGNPSVVATLPIAPKDLIAADLNRDGIPDLVCSTTPVNAVNRINVMRTSTSGVPEIRQVLTVSGVQTQFKLAVADVNRDGIVDLLATQYTTGSLLVYLGVGDGTFNPSPAAFSVGSSPTGLVVTDLNNDGRVDAVVTNFSDSTSSVLMGVGDGTFQPRVATAAGVTLPNHLALADMNGDGKLDLIISGSGQTLAVRLGNGNGTFAAATTTVAVNMTSTSNKMVVADVTGDGVPDALQMNNSAASIFLFKGRANGTLETDQAVSLPLPGRTLRTFSVADLNADGRADLSLVYGDIGAAAYPAVALGNGNGTFAAPIALSQSTSEAPGYVSTTADLNLDMRPDLIHVNGNGVVATTLSISAAIKLIWGQGNIVYPAGTSAVVTVFAEGTGLQYEWFKNGSPLVNTARVFALGRFLELDILNSADSGVYQCRIFNACSSITTSSYVHVMPASNPCPVDFDGDGFITFEDFDAFVQAFEEGC